MAIALRITRPLPDIVGGTVAGVFVCVGVLRLLWRAWAHGEFVGVTLDAFPELLVLCTLGLGALLLGLGWPRSLGNSITCRTCGYRVLEPPDRLISECPECNNSWRWFGRSRRGERVARRGVLWGGVLCVLVALAGSYFRREMISAAVRSMGTPALMRTAVHSPAITALPAWEELMARTLTPGEATSLSLDLLDVRRQRGGLYLPMEQWLETSVSTAIVGPSVRQRFLSEMLTLKLSAPDVAVVGEAVPVAIRGTMRHGSGELAGGTVCYTMSGFGWTSLNPVQSTSPASWPGPLDSARPGRPESGRPAITFREKVLDLDSVLVFNEPGVYRVWTRAWIYVDPRMNSVLWANDSLQWGGGVEIIRETELVHEITIRARQ